MCLWTYVQPFGILSYSFLYWLSLSMPVIPSVAFMRALDMRPQRSWFVQFAVRVYRYLNFVYILYFFVTRIDVISVSSNFMNASSKLCQLCKGFLLVLEVLFDVLYVALLNTCCRPVQSTGRVILCWSLFGSYWSEETTKRFVISISFPKPASLSSDECTKVGTPIYFFL